MRRNVNRHCTAINTDATPHRLLSRLCDVVVLSSVDISDSLSRTKQ